MAAKNKKTETRIICTGSDDLDKKMGGGIPINRRPTRLWKIRPLSAYDLGLPKSRAECRVFHDREHNEKPDHTDAESEFGHPGFLPSFTFADKPPGRQENESDIARHHPAHDQ